MTRLVLVLKRGAKLFGGEAFDRAICDLGAGNLFSFGNPHDRLVDAHTLQEGWRMLAMTSAS